MISVIASSFDRLVENLRRGATIPAKAWRTVLALAAGLFAFGAARADIAPPAPAAPAAQTEPAAQIIEAHPAFWVAHGKHGTVYLLGSVHILPPNLRWRTPEISAAIAKADVFAFEIPTGEGAMDAMRDLIQKRGTLLPGESLRAMLSPEGQNNFDKALALTGIQLAFLDGKRPWLAGLMFNVARMMKETGSIPQAGLDAILSREAIDRQKDVRYMETAEQQIDLLAPKDDSTLELEQFESGLKKFLTQSTDSGRLLTAWASGDPAQIDALFNDEMKEYPKARKALLDDRNRAWVKKIGPMLDKEDKVFFITVGAGHLVGRNGVPNLLRRAGYTVDGPP